MTLSHPQGRTARHQQKTGAALILPVVTELQAALDAMPPCAGPFRPYLAREGQPFEPLAFTCWFIRAARAAGLPPEDHPTAFGRSPAAVSPRRAAPPPSPTASARTDSTGPKHLVETLVETRLATLAGKDARPYAKQPKTDGRFGREPYNRRILSDIVQFGHTTVVSSSRLPGLGDVLTARRRS
jgi:hypothetical protein